MATPIQAEEANAPAINLKPNTNIFILLYRSLFNEDAGKYY